jgi:hypothetical protein
MIDNKLKTNLLFIINELSSNFVKKILMKNRLLAAFLFFSVYSSAQIVLDESSYSATVLGTDSIANTTYNSSFPVLTPSANATWDMTVITDSVAPSFVYRVATAPAYEFADSNDYYFGSYFYQGNVQSSITTTGLLQYGIKISWTGYNIFSVTHSAGDSLIITDQMDTFSSPRTLVSFPATDNSTWASVYHNDFDFQLSVALLSYSHAPGTLRSYTTEKDTVMGYGKMRIKNLDGTASSYFNVLQVQAEIITVDSFFLNGSPAPGVLLTQLRFTQGQADTSYYQSYYRPGEVTPLAQIFYNDQSFSHPVSAKTHVQRLVNEGVANIANGGEVAIYPNPIVAGAQVSINLVPAAGEWSYELTDIAGEKVQSGALKIYGNAGQFSLSPALKTGNFYLTLYHSGAECCVKTLQVQ